MHILLLNLSIRNGTQAAKKKKVLLLEKVERKDTRTETCFHSFPPSFVAVGYSPHVTTLSNDSVLLMRDGFLPFCFHSSAFFIIFFFTILLLPQSSGTTFLLPVCGRRMRSIRSEGRRNKRWRRHHGGHRRHTIGRRVTFCFHLL